MKFEYKISISKYAFEIDICKMVSILFRLQCVKYLNDHEQQVEYLFTYLPILEKDNKLQLSFCLPLLTYGSNQVWRLCDVGSLPRILQMHRSQLFLCRLLSTLWGLQSPVFSVGMIASTDYHPSPLFRLPWHLELANDHIHFKQGISYHIW